MKTLDQHPPFDVDLARLLPVGSIAFMTPPQIGVAYRVLRLAWSLNGSVCGDLPTLIRSAGLMEADLVLVQGLINLAGQPEANGKSITFPILREVLRATRGEIDRRSRAGRAGASARWKVGSGPPPGPGLRLMRSQCDRTAVASAALCNSGSSSGAESAVHESEADQRCSAGISKDGDGANQRRKIATGPDPKSYIVNTEDLPLEKQVAEHARRSAVRRRLLAASFPRSKKWKQLPHDRVNMLSLAWWVTERDACHACWLAAKLLSRYASDGKSFNHVGFIINQLGMGNRGFGRCAPIDDMHFEAYWSQQRTLRQIHEQREREAAIAMAAKRPQSPVAGGSA